MANSEIMILVNTLILRNVERLFKLLRTNFFDQCLYVTLFSSGMTDFVGHSGRSIHSAAFSLDFCSQAHPLNSAAKVPKFAAMRVVRAEPPNRLFVQETRHWMLEPYQGL